MSGSVIIYAKAQLMFDRRIMYVGPKCVSDIIIIFAEPQYFMSGSAIIYAKPLLLFDGRIIYVGPKCMSAIVIICLNPSGCLTLS